MKMNTPNNSTHSRMAFTVMELLVVIVIAVLLLTIAVPAFQSTIYSSNRSLAVNALEASSVMARDAALSTGKDGAVVFVYDPEVQRVNIIPAIKVGTLRETSTAPSGPGGGFASGFGDLPYFDRDVFVPAPVGQVLSIPDYWMVRGYAAPGMLLDVDSRGEEAATWYNSSMYGDDNVNDSVKREAHWVFPETGFFPRNAQVNGGSLDGSLSTVNRDLPTARQSFMIRFDARTGAVSRDTRSALFVDPRNSRERIYGDQPSSNQQTLRVDLAESLEVWATRVLSSPDVNGDGLAYGNDDEQLREQLIGTASNDTILVKPVSRVALYDERDLVLGIGARGLNTETQSIYLPHDQNQRDVDIQFDTTLFDTSNEADIVRRIDQWINGNTTYTANNDLVIDFEDEPLSRLYLVQSYTGELKEVLR
ncbi:MAG: Tfp pilus assembly protein FimT/FimU [Phycisphaerales bacterium JB052]